MASVLKIITITIVPLLGLGSNQDEKCYVNSDAFESYHLDEFCGSHAKLLRSQLKDYTHDKKCAIVLFLSPQIMAKNSVTRGCISAICIDKVHSTVHNFESFHPEFKTAMD